MRPKPCHRRRPARARRQCRGTASGPGAEGRRRRMRIVRVCEHAHLRNVEPGDLVLGGNAVAGELADDEQRDRRHRRHVHDVRRDADALRVELRRVAEKEPGHAFPGLRSIRHRTSRWRRVPSERMPQIPHVAVHARGADRVVDPELLLDEHGGDDDENARDGADQNGSRRADERARRRDRDHAGEHAVRKPSRIRAPVAIPDVESRGKGTGCRRQHGVHRDDADARIGEGQGRARIEAEPAEREDEGAEQRHRDVVTGHRVCSAVPRVLADARTEHLGADQGGHAAGHVDHGASREIHVTVTEPVVLTERGKPAAAPNPVCIDGIDDGRNHEAEEHEGR